MHVKENVFLTCTLMVLNNLIYKCSCRNVFKQDDHGQKCLARYFLGINSWVLTICIQYLKYLVINLGRCNTITTDLKCHFLS